MTTLAGLMYARPRQEGNDIAEFPVWADYGLIHRQSDVQVTVTMDTLMLQLLNEDPATVFVEIEGEIREVDKSELEVDL